MVLQRRSILRAGILLFFFVTGFSACAPSSFMPPAVVQIDSHSGFSHAYDDFVIVKTVAGDTFAGLAERFLKDPAKGWVIAEFNEITTLTPGEIIVIPLQPVALGGLKADRLQKVPILLYHDFSQTRSSKMKVLASSFEAQMKFLKDNGYRVIPLAQFLNFLDFKEQIPEKSVVITIDDGWKSLHTIAYPIIKKYGFPVTLFVYTDFIGGSKALTWNQVRELSDNGFDIQCHTKTHRDLARIKDRESFEQFFQDIEKEILQSKSRIKKRLNVDCSVLAYPYGKTSSLVAAMLRKHGYQAAFTVSRGGNPFYLDRYNLNRSVIYGHYDLDKFKQNLDIFEPLKSE